MAYEVLPGFSGFGSLGGAGDVLGEGCLCGGPGVCTTAKLQAPAMAQLRAAMAAAGLPTSTGNWTTKEQNAMNALARSDGQPVSSKFLVDGGPCRALKARLAAPPPAPVANAVSCTSLLAQLPPIPVGTPLSSVLTVLQQMAPAGFDVAACQSQIPMPSPVPAPGPVVGPTPGPVVMPPADGEASNTMLYVGLGVLALLGLGGAAYAATRGKMKRNGRRRRRAMRRNGSVSRPAVARSKAVYQAGYRAGLARAQSYEAMLGHRGMTDDAASAITSDGQRIAARKAALAPKERMNFANGYYFGVADAHGMG
jgi:hypothetical protein